MLRQHFKKWMSKSGNKLPDVIIIGAQKCATSSLFDEFIQHPSIVGSWIKEVHFFDHENKYQAGLNWYKKQFPYFEGDQLLMEASPRYLYHPRVPERIKKLDKSLKFIVSFRNPIDRAYSAWNMYMRIKESWWQRYKFSRRRSENHFLYDYLWKEEEQSFEYWIQRELELIHNGKKGYEPSIIARGFYQEQLTDWWEYFPKERFHYINFDTIKLDYAKTVNEVYAFLGVTQIGTAQQKSSNVGKYNKTAKDKLSKGVYQQLEDLYQEKNKNLSQLTGLNFEWIK